MKELIKDIKNKDFKKIYLIYGEEEYLKKQYRDMLKEAVVSDDTMNYSYFSQDGCNVRNIIDVCETMPFFSERRLVVIEDSKYLKSSNEEFADYIDKLPDYLVIIMLEKEIDKRNKVYKAIDRAGYICEMKPQTEAVLKKWIAKLFKEENLLVTEKACELLIEKTGADMNLIKQETEKLISFCQGREAVNEKDVEAICSTQTVSRIFDMITAMATKKQKEALDLYYDLLTLKEPPMRILYLIVRQFNGILQAKEFMNSGVPYKEIASKMGVAPFIAGKYQAQAKLFTESLLKEALAECAEVEESVKQGKLNDKLSVELIIIKYSV